MDCKTIAARTRLAGELIELFRIDGEELTRLSVDAWGDIGMHVQVDCFLRIQKLTGAKVSRRPDSTHFVMASHGAEWVCVCEESDLEKFAAFAEPAVVSQPAPELAEVF